MKPILITSLILILFFVPVGANSFFSSNKQFTAGFVPEFMERPDGYQGLRKEYGFVLKTKEMDSQLMFQALKAGRVDVISGYSTEGRIKVYDFFILEDDKIFFPPYYACPLVNSKTLRKYPFLNDIFSKVAGKITNEKMAELNFQVEYNRKSPKEVAINFLKELGLNTDIERTGKPDIVIGSKNFTEQFILAEIFSILIENYSDLTVELKKGLAGTKLCFESLKSGLIDIYPEYTGTGLFVILKVNKNTQDLLLSDSKRVYEYVKNKTKKYFDVDWLQPLGFNNTWVLMMRKEDANKFMIRTISDLKGYLN